MLFFLCFFSIFLSFYTPIKSIEPKNIIRAKGTNTNLAEPKEKDGVKVISKGVIKETNLDITKKAEKQEITARK